MRTIIVGTGKLATELLDTLSGDHIGQLVRWNDKGCSTDQTIIIHAGSGKQLNDVITYCERTNSTLVELSTGSSIAIAHTSFPVVLCPNTNILMLKFMSMLAKSGHLFIGCRMTLIESHQAQKTSVPGTAASLAHSLGMHESEIRTVRDPELQKTELQIPVEHLGRHAFHRIVIEDTACSLTLETRVYGSAPYAQGVSLIISAIRSTPLENRLYTINEFVQNGWI
jgi:4-hydroxy-tetrahydrodipicolinate reductase